MRASNRGIRSCWGGRTWRRRRAGQRPEHGEVGVGARGHGRSHGWARSAPGRVLSTLPCSGVSYGGSSTVCDIAGGEELSAPTVGAVRRHGRARGERGNGQGLTRGRERSSVGSGKPLQRRIDDGDLRAPEMKTTTLRSTAASSGRVRRVCSSTGSGRSSGMHSGSEGVAVAPVTASAAMGSARARAGREAEEGTGSRGGEGGLDGSGRLRGISTHG